MSHAFAQMMHQITESLSLSLCVSQGAYNTWDKPVDHNLQVEHEIQGKVSQFGDFGLSKPIATPGQVMFD